MLGDTACLLVTGGTTVARERMAALLHRIGYDNVVVSAGMVETGAGIRPDLIIALGDVLPICAAVRQLAAFARVPLLAVVPSDPPGDARAAAAAGADEVIGDPVKEGVLEIRVRRLLTASADHESAQVARRCEEGLIEMQRMASAPSGEVAETLRELLLVAGGVMEFDRASVVLLGPLGDSAYVVAATDDLTLSKFAVDLEQYPELRACLSSLEVVLLGDAPAHPMMADRAGTLREHEVRSIAAFPIEWRRRAIGALYLRSRRTGASDLGARRVAFGRLAAGIVAQVCAGGQILDSLREQTHRVSLARYETERRLRAIEALQSYFDAGSDGVVVLDGDGLVLFVNHAAESISGWARDGLIGNPLADLVPESQREGLSEVIGRVLAGTNLEAFDLEITTTSGEPITVSVATSTVLSDHGAAILTFRDVTAERALESELRKTKEFLERLIDSTVDAIVAADIEGNLMLFNPGAERLFGWRAAEVVGVMPVERLYPEGVARQIMRMLRSSSYGGVGRLELTRREVLTKDGDVIPVNMTASILYEDEREVATVGILSDLRDRIRIEQRLLQAQEKLLITEKQAVIAELAGAAAHELNQPLTSVLLSLELLARRMPAEDPHRRSLDTAYREATRMAEIVKKIGKITKYETKAYVGSTAILDLEKSSEAQLPEHERRPKAEGES